MIGDNDGGRSAHAGMRTGTRMRSGSAAARHDWRQCDRRSAGRRCGRRLPYHNSRRRPHEGRNDGDVWRRQEETLARRRWRRQDSKFTRPRRQEEDRWWRRRRVIAPPKRDHRPINNSQFFRRRRRNAEIDECEIGRSVDRPTDHRQAAPRIPDMRAVWIAPEIGPISRRRVVENAAAPDHLLAAHCYHRGDAWCIATSWIERQKLLVAIDRVERERGRVCIVDAGIAAHRLVAQIPDRSRVGRRRRIGRAFREQKRRVDLRNIPGHFGAVCHLADTQACAREHIIQ
jgi:hypothetical protein